MYLLFKVAVAMAPGTPGIGYVTTALPFSHTREVSPALSTPSLRSVPGLAPRLAPSCAVRSAPAIAALGAPWGLAHRRISRSSTAPGIGVAFPFPGTISAPAMSSFQAYCPLTTSTFEYVCPLDRVQVY